MITLGQRMPPLLRFVLLGVPLWLGQSYAERQEFFVVDSPSEQSLEVAYLDWARRAGAYPNDQQRRDILQTEIEDRVLFKEALRQQLYREDAVVEQRLLRNAGFIGMEGDDAEKVRMAFDLGLHRNDEIIRRHLIEKLKMQVRARAHPIQPPGADILQARYVATRERWKRAPGIEMEHVFFSADSTDQGARVVEAGRQLEAVASAGAAAYSLGDAFLFGNRMPRMALPRLADRFGAGFAERLEDAIEAGELRPGAVDWYGPVASSYGAHFVRVLSYDAAGRPTLAEVEGTLTHEYERSVEKDVLKAYVAELCEQYGVGRS